MSAAINKLSMQANGTDGLSQISELLDQLGTAIDASNAELLRLKRIEAMALACDGIDMGRHYEVPTEAWEALMTATWEGQEVKP